MSAPVASEPQINIFFSPEKLLKKLVLVITTDDPASESQTVDLLVVYHSCKS